MSEMKLGYKWGTPSSHMPRYSGGGKLAAAWWGSGSTPYRHALGDKGRSTNTEAQLPCRASLSTFWVASSLALGTSIRSRGQMDRAAPTVDGLAT